MTLDQATTKKTGIEGIQSAEGDAAADKASTEANGAKKKGTTGASDNTKEAPKTAAKTTDATNESAQEEPSVADRLFEDAYDLWSWGKKKAKALVGIEDKPEEAKPDAQVAAAAHKPEAPKESPEKKADAPTVNASTTTEAPKEDTRAWWSPSRLWDKTKEYASGAWDVVTKLSSDAYNAVISSEGAPDTKVEAKMVDGKPTYFTAETVDFDKREVRGDGITTRTSENGDTIKIDRKTGEVASQSRDGKDVFIRKADGTQIYLDKETGVEYERKGDKMYARDKNGNQWEVNNEEVRRKIGGTMDEVIQRFGKFDDNEPLLRPGQRRTNGDGTTSMGGEDGTTVMRPGKGTIELHTPEGILVVDKNTKEPLGVRKKNSDELEKIDENHPMWAKYQRMKARMGQWGRIRSEDGRAEMHQDDKGNGVIEGRHPDGRPAYKIETKPTGESTITDERGEKQTYNPNAAPGEPKVTFTDKDDKPIWSYTPGQGDDFGTFDTRGVTFNDDGALTKWDGSFISNDGSVRLSDGSYLYIAGEQAYQEAAAKTTEACTNAAGVAGEVSGKCAIGTVEFSDVAKLKGALGDLSAALGMCLAAGNFEAAAAIISAQATVESVIGSAECRAAVGAELRARGIFSGDAIAEAQKGLGGNTIMSAVENEERHVRGYTLSDPRSVEAALNGNRDQAKSA